MRSAGWTKNTSLSPVALLAFLDSIGIALSNLNQLSCGDTPVKTGFTDAFDGNHTVLNRVQRMVLARAYIFASHKFSTSLADNDVAFFDLFPRIELHAQVFWLGIGEVFC